VRTIVLISVLMSVVLGCSSPELEIAHQQDVARSRATSLPVDYRDIAYVVLKDMLAESEIVNLRQRYFVSVFGRDLEPVLRERFAKEGIQVLPGSAYVESLEIRKSADGEVFYRNTEVQIYSIEAAQDHTYRVRYGYHCGNLCAGSFDSYLKFEAGMWQVIRTDLRWIS
jgi:hypothetical protein